MRGRRIWEIGGFISGAVLIVSVSSPSTWESTGTRRSATSSARS
jgi:hypothetical protein